MARSTPEARPYSAMREFQGRARPLSRAIPNKTRPAPAMATERKLKWGKPAASASLATVMDRAIKLPTKIRQAKAYTETLPALGATTIDCTPGPGGVLAAQEMIEADV